MARIMQGQIAAFFAFDIGYEVSLDKLSAEIATTPVQPISRKKLTPTYLQFTRRPQILHLGLVTGHFPVKGTIQATVYDFGAVSISYRWPINEASEIAVDDLPRISRDLYDLDLELDARDQVENLLRKIGSAIIRPHLSGMVEDYYLFIIEKLDEPLKAEEFIQHHRTTLAQMLRFEKALLSRNQQEEALSQLISYYETDLVLIDWNAALIYDPDYEDTANVLELLNVELLEARNLDAQLDQKIIEYEKLARRPMPFPIPLRKPYKKALQGLADLRLESSILSERVENALKLVGDIYLAKLHRVGTQRFYLPEWNRIIAGKLEIISRFYELLTERVHTMQSQTLELIIVGLILLEIVLAFVK